MATDVELVKLLCEQLHRAVASAESTSANDRRRMDRMLELMDERLRVVEKTCQALEHIPDTIAGIDGRVRAAEISIVKISLVGGLGGLLGGGVFQLLQRFWP